MASALERSDTNSITFNERELSCLPPTVANKAKEYGVTKLDLRKGADPASHSLHLQLAGEHSIPFDHTPIETSDDSFSVKKITLDQNTSFDVKVDGNVMQLSNMRGIGFEGVADTGLVDVTLSGSLSNLQIIQNQDGTCEMNGNGAALIAGFDKQTSVNNTYDQAACEAIVRDLLFFKEILPETTPGTTVASRD